MSSKTKTTAMKEEATPALVPKLRFPEFRGSQEWDRMPLARVCDVLQGYGFPEAIQGKANGKYPFCKVSDISRAVAENAGVLAEAANYVDEAEVGMLRAKPIPPGATVFAKIGEALRLNRRAYVLNSCLIDNNAVALKGIDGLANDYFIYSLSQLIDLNNHCGGAVPSVNKTTLQQIQVCVPSLNEQKKIAECLSSVDELMAAQARKVDALKTHKKGLMQQLFPREGETQPRLRFPQFQNAGEWEKTTIGALGNFYYGKSAPKWSLEDEAPTPCVRYGELYTKFGPIITETYSRTNIDPTTLRFSKGGEILVPRVGEKPEDFGKCCCYLPLKGIAIGEMISVFETEQDPLFYTYYFRHLYRQFARVVEGQNVKNLYYAVLQPLAICRPPLPEQQRIASCLSSLDALITAETQKLEALKIHKKGLMQQLFPSPEELEA